MGMSYIRNYYGVPARRGGRVTVDGRPGVICSANKSYLMVRFDGEKYPRKCHPTWRVSYQEPPNIECSGQAHALDGSAVSKSESQG